MKYNGHSLRADKFYHIADGQILSNVQEMTQKRHKSKRMKKAFMKDKDNFNEDMYVLAMYIHTAYEMGRIDGGMDIDHIVDETLKQFGSKNLEQTKEVISKVLGE